MGRKRCEICWENEVYGGSTRLGTIEFSHCRDCLSIEKLKNEGKLPELEGKIGSYIKQLKELEENFINDISKIIKTDENANLIDLFKFKTIELTPQDEENSKDPYIKKMKFTIREVSEYNPRFGDEKICECGDSYYRHFDSYEDMRASGCKYCSCNTFKEKVEKTQED